MALAFSGHWSRGIVESGAALYWFFARVCARFRTSSCVDSKPMTKKSLPLTKAKASETSWLGYALCSP